MILYPFWYLALCLLSKLGDRWIWAQRFLIGESYTRSSGLHVPLHLAGAPVVPEHLQLDRGPALPIAHQPGVDHVNQPATTTLEAKVLPR